MEENNEEYKSILIMSLACEISGELLGSVKAEDEIVVTPSGHVCIKRLLLTKLAENGGMDPFQPTGSNLPLSEDQLVTLQKPSTASAAAPPRPQATSLPNLLSMMQQEYDALVLELFDTRKALEDTRRELSQALYQNDAAIRVVARLSQERDQARRELEQWNASVGPSTAGASATTADDATPGSEGGEPDRKRRRVEALDPDAPPLQNDIPQSVYDDMDEAWKPLSAGRKAMLKAAAAEAPTPEDLASYQDVDQKAWHKSSCKGVPTMSKSGSLVATAGKDKQIVVYHEVEQVVKDTFNFGTVATCVDVGPGLVVAGDSKGKITVYGLAEDGSGDGLSATAKTGGNAAVVSVRVHPSQNQIVVGTAKGQILIYAIALEEKRLQLVSTFVNDEADQFTCGELHPDGLLYAAGTKIGAVQIWDFRSKTLAFELKVRTTTWSMTTIMIMNVVFVFIQPKSKVSLSQNDYLTRIIPLLLLFLLLIIFSSNNRMNLWKVTTLSRVLQFLRMDTPSLSRTRLPLYACGMSGRISWQLL